MARAGNAGTALVQSAAGSPLSRWSLHGWYRALAVPVGTRFSQPITLGATFNDIDAGFSYDHSSTAAQQSIFNRRAIALGGTYDNAKFTTALQPNTWYAVGGSYDGTNVNAYLNGLLETQVGSADIEAAALPIASVFNKYSGDAPDDGTVGEVGYWNVALTAGEFLMLGRGVSPLHVRPESLILYWPLYGTDSPETDWSGRGLPGTVTSTTVVDHPPVQLPFWGVRGSVYAVVVQIAVPVADVSAGGWTPSTGTDLYAMLDETVADDTDYIQSARAPANAEAKVRLGPLTDPNSSTGHIVRYRFYKNPDGGARGDLTVTLYAADGTTVITSQVQTNVAPGVVDGTFTLTGPQADAIPSADYAVGLVLGLKANAP